MLTIQDKLCGDLLVKECVYDFIGPVDSLDSYKVIYLHNTVKHTDLSELLSYSRSRGLSGIGYHFALNPKGEIYSVRPLNIMGAHVYGKNQNSVGIVFLNVDECVSSPACKKSFDRLHTYLSQTINHKLPVHSHTFGQFEYLNDVIAKSNLPLPMLEFDEEVCHKDKLRKYQVDFSNGLNRIVPKSTEEQKKLSSIIRAFERIKICPGPGYFHFANGL